ncbi:MAG TPA: glutathione S-transferase family protein, partial [Steroidobacteraceae bacterium]|nr:glutathione S-transferase family protein [Steroidobacteraceae bacterium]
FSTFARRVRIMLVEKNIPYESIEVDMKARAHRAPPYLKMNPYGRVPALVEDDFVLFESTSILNYLEATHPTPALIPADARGRALVDMHMKLCDIQLTRQTTAIVFPKRFLPPERWDLNLFAQMKAEIEKHLAILEAQLGSNDYLVRNTFSLADLTYLPFLEFLPMMEITPPPAVAAWSARMSARPSAVQTKPAG